ncbi:MAG: hypothetical protein IPG71_01645 [bacterium]|nr:hypothetical protein [bacterium]
MKQYLKYILIAAALGAFAALAYGQAEDMKQFKGDPLNRAKNYMSGNLVQTVFYNYGLVGNIGEISGEWPIGTGNEYVGDVSPLVGIEFIHPSGDTLRSVCTTDGPRGSPDGPAGGGAFWGFEALPGFNAPGLGGRDPLVAMSNQDSTWPSIWPDKFYSDSLSGDKGWARDHNDPGWRGSWNGYFGKDVMNADQETYFQMDDHADLEWFMRTDSLGNPQYYYPLDADTSRRGLGLRVLVRGLQWAHFMAQDVIFWLYEVTNISDKTYDKVSFGMVVGTLSGGRQDSNDDLADFDIENDITYSYDNPLTNNASPGWDPVSDNILVGYVGYAFLESPGNPLDGIDNDGDSQDPSSPRLTGDVLSQMLQPRAFVPGQQIILIDYDTYERTISQFPISGALRFDVHGREYMIEPGVQVVEDGGNGIDDNLNGLIDERGGHQDLAYVNYFTGAGLSDLLLDEARDDGIDNDGDWDLLTDDVGSDGVPASGGDAGEADGQPTNGEPHFDKTDIDESDQIGLTAFDYFAPSNAVRMRDDEAIWTRMTPGHFTPEESLHVARDGDFIYGSGYFPLRPGQTERFSMALAYGEDLADITDNKITVQQIYDDNYNFARPPEKPTLWAVPGDGRVTLYWDGRASEASLDPVCHCYDFEGYKIYRSTDAAFNEVFTVTDGLGRKVFHQPIEQFDLDNSLAYVDTTYFQHVDSAKCDSFHADTTQTWTYVWCYRDSLIEDSNAVSVSGFFPLIRNSVIYYLGDNSGLQHSWVDTTVENGQTYYYALVAYDRGDINRGILPAENSKTILQARNGDLTLDINTVVVTPRAPVLGYEPPEFSLIEHFNGSGTGTIAIETVDPGQVQDDRVYSFKFDRPTSTSSVSYSILRSFEGQTDTLVDLAPLTVEQNLLVQAQRFGSYYDSLFNLEPGTFDPVRYFGVAGSQIYDGQRAYILTPWQESLIQAASGWADTSKGLYDFIFNLANYGNVYLFGTALPGDFLIEWGNGVVDTSQYFNWYNLLEWPATPVDFRIKNQSTNEYINFAFDELPATTNGMVDHGEVIIFMEDTLITWSLEFRERPANGDTIRPSAGDELLLRLYQSYTSRDEFRYTTKAAKVNPDAVDLDRINVYPNPYVAASPQEPPNQYAAGARRTANYI